MLARPDGWSQRIEKVINFTGITTCQAVNTHRFVCLRAKTEQLSLLLGGGAGARARARAERRLGEGSGDQLKSVIHYCQVHSLLKRGAIKAQRWKNVISKQSRLVTSGTNRPFLSRVIMHQMKISPLGFGCFASVQESGSRTAKASFICLFK